MCLGRAKTTWSTVLIVALKLSLKKSKPIFGLCQKWLIALLPVNFSSSIAQMILPSSMYATEESCPP